MGNVKKACSDWVESGLALDTHPLAATLENQRLAPFAADKSANLDFLRAYAVLAVYFGHLFETFGIRYVLPFITVDDLAQTGVVIFFVHTSLVLMLSLARMRLTGWRLFASFYIRRVFRIYPLSILAVLTMISIHIPPFPTSDYLRPSVGEVISNLTLTQNLVHGMSLLAPLWSLPYEVQMYLVLPFLFVFLKKRRSLWIPLCLWIVDVATLLVIGAVRVKGAPLLLWFTPCFLGGIIAYQLRFRRGARLSFWGWPLLITACVLFRALAGSQSAWVACLALGLASPHFRELGVGWIRKAAATIATYSYGIYVSHIIAFWIAFVACRSKAASTQLLLCAFLSVLLPLLLYHGLEQPMINVGKRIARFCHEQSAARAAA